MRNILLCLFVLALFGCDKEPISQQPVEKPEEKPIDFGVPHNEIWYTTSDRQTINPLWGPSLEHEIVSNTYQGNKAIMQFAGDITTIGNGLFSNIYNLTSMTLPSSVTSIGVSAFENSNKLSRIDLPSSITEIGKAAFASCALTDIEVPKDVTILSYRVFAQNPDLRRVTLPKGLKKISESAFSACFALKTIEIPNSVEQIERCAFTQCRSLEMFSGAFATEDGRALIMGDKLVAFAPYGITSYEIPHNVKIVGDTAFGACEELESITIPEGVTDIEQSAFMNCTKLESITIPSSVKTMGNNCCRTYGSNLVVYCKPTTPPTALLVSQNYWGAFAANEITIYVPMESVEAYKAAEHWSSFKDNIVGYDF